MATNNPLFVPMVVNAFAVNQNVLADKGANICRLQFAYPFLNTYSSPAPKPFSGGNYPSTGVALFWDLPKILREGTESGGSLDFPLVPNRWLVVRYNGPVTARTATAWVVQSDFLGNSDPITGGSPYLQPNATTIQPTFVGQVVSLSNWNEPNPPSLFLTAVAPANTTFASYQPYCQNVFSLFDPLDGVSSEDTLSYLVAGWYSNQSDDIVGSWQASGSFTRFLARAGWDLPEGSPDDTATWAMYHGMVWGLEWNLTGPAPSNVPNPADIRVAVGNTTVDAFGALIAQQSGNDWIDAGLLQAFQHGMLSRLDNPDPQFELQQAIHQSWFSAHSGGYGWDIVDAQPDPSQTDPPTPISPEERANEEQWLAELNQQQAAYDSAAVALADQQWNLYQVWWKYGNAQGQGFTNPYPDGTSQQQFTDALDPTNPSSLVSLVNAAQQNLQQMATTIPTGSTQEELQAAIQAYAAQKQLPPTRQLKQVALRPTNQAVDPVVLMQGLGADAPLTPNEPLASRFLSQLVTGFTYGSGNTSEIVLSQVQSAIPVPANMSAVPTEAQNLLDEFFFLDPTNATMVAEAALGTTDSTTVQELATAMQGGANVIGVCPDIDLAVWTQPWRPLVLMWDVLYYPINHDDRGQDLWTFDGNDYTWNGVGHNPDAQPWEYQSLIFMTPQASFNFRAQVMKFIDEHPNADGLEEFYDFVEQIDDWDFLSQSLVGMNQMMTLRDPRPNVSASLDPTQYYPGVTLASLVQSNADYVPYPGQPQPPPFESFPPSGFQNWRAGQFLIRRLWVMDRFGQTCEVVNSQTQAGFSPVLAPSLVPQHPVLRKEPARFIQLPPRLLQPARLNFDFLSASDDSDVLGLEPSVNPVCAWLLHNFIDESIVTYDNQGNALGAISTVTNDEDQEVVVWTASPGSAYATIADLLNTPALVQLGQMLTELQSLGADAFRSLSKTLDEASWNISGSETTTDLGLTLLAGRPVAMVRARLQFLLEGAAVTDPSWRFTFSENPNPMTNWRFNIRLGEAGQNSDGLIGYYASTGSPAATDYSTLYAPNVPEGLPDPSYITPIGTGAAFALPFDGATTAILTLLMDPRSVVHATTGILPVISVAIPQTFVGQAFAQMDLMFTIGPVLTASVHAQDDPAPAAVVMPRPSVKNGTWAWQQFDGSAWSTFDVTPATPTAQFSNVPPVLREGLLRLTGAMSGETSPAPRVPGSRPMRMVPPPKGPRA